MTLSKPRQTRRMGGFKEIRLTGGRMRSRAALELCGACLDLQHESLGCFGLRLQLKVFRDRNRIRQIRRTTRMTAALQAHANCF